MKAISIVMPVYNAEKYLVDCLDSVIGQSFKDFELICVDDGSSDNTVAILLEYSNRDNRIKLLRQSHLSGGAARNKGMMVAKGEYIIFLDADDIFYPHMLQALYNQIRKTKADICLCAADYFDSKTRKIYGKIDGTLDVSGCPSEVFSWRDNKSDFFRCTNPAPWSKLYRHQFLIDVGIEFQPLPNSNDLFFTSCTLLAAKKITYVDECLLIYRINNVQSSQGSSAKNPTCFLTALLEINRWIREQGIYEEVRESYNKLVMRHIYYNMRKYEQLLDSDNYEKLIALVNSHESELGVAMKIKKDDTSDIMIERKSMRNEETIQSDVLGKLSDILWANIYHDTIVQSDWLLDKTISPGGDGRWAVGYNFLYALYRILDEMHPKNILELGLGQSTRLTGQYAGYFKARHAVVEHDKDWADFFFHGWKSETKQTHIYLTDIEEREIDGEKYFAYCNFDHIVNDLPAPCNLILIDGPFGGRSARWCYVKI